MLIVNYWSTFQLSAQLKVSLVYISISLLWLNSQLPLLPDPLTTCLTPPPPFCLLNLLCVSIYFLLSSLCLSSDSLPFLPLHSSRRHCCLFQIQTRRGGCAGLPGWSFLCSRTYWSCLQLTDWTYMEKSDFAIHSIPTTLNSQCELTERQHTLEFVTCIH